MSDDRVRLHVEASVVYFSSSRVFFLEILYRRCVLATPYRITMKTQILEAQV